MNPSMESTKLKYFDDMFALISTAILRSHHQGDDGRHVLILDATIFYPQGGGQPADTGLIVGAKSGFRFSVNDVRIKDTVVYHYGFFENSQDNSETKIENGEEVLLHVDAERRHLNSRLHSAGHLLDACLNRVGLSHLEPGKGYHFPDGPFVEYKGTIPQDMLQTKQQELESEANALIKAGGKVFVSILPYEEALKLCGGVLPDYISEGSTPRIVQLGDNPGGPCGGTHVANIAEVSMFKIKKIRIRKGCTRVFYDISH